LKKAGFIFYKYWKIYHFLLCGGILYIPEFWEMKP